MSNPNYCVYNIKNREVSFEGDSLFVVDGRLYYSVYEREQDGVRFDDVFFDEFFLTHYQPKGSQLGNDGLPNGLDVVGLMRLEQATLNALSRDETLRELLIRKQNKTV